MELSGISQAQKERLSHIDFRTYFLGEIGRSDSVARFGIGEAAGTRDITLYRELSPANLDYDTRLKFYIKLNSFNSLFEYSPPQVLAALSQGFGEDFIGSHKPMVRCETPAKLSRPLLPVFARAIYHKKAVKIQYRSIQSGLSECEIVPFVLGDNGLSWHVRAFDRNRQSFIDFVVTRIANPVMFDDEPKEHEFSEADI